MKKEKQNEVLGIEDEGDLTETIRKLPKEVEALRLDLDYVVKRVRVCCGCVITLPSKEAEKVHPIGFLNAIGQRAAQEQQERYERLTRNPKEPRIGDN